MNFISIISPFYIFIMCVFPFDLVEIILRLSHPRDIVLWTRVSRRFQRHIQNPKFTCITVDMERANCLHLLLRSQEKPLVEKVRVIYKLAGTCKLKRTIADQVFDPQFHNLDERLNCDKHEYVQMLEFVIALREISTHWVHCWLQFEITCTVSYLHCPNCFVETSIMQLRRNGSRCRGCETVGKKSWHWINKESIKTYVYKVWANNKGN